MKNTSKTRVLALILALSLVITLLPAAYAADGGDPSGGGSNDDTTTDQPDSNDLKITLDKDTLSLNVGDTDKLTAQLEADDITGITVTWTSSEPSVATVTDGTVTAVGAGTTTITATAGNQSATCTVTVTAATVPVTGVTLDKTTAKITIPETLQLKATVMPDNATDSAVTWTSSNDAVATVDGNGLVTAKAAGTATITAKAGDKTATCVVTVEEIKITSITPEKTTVTDLSVKGTVKLSPVIAPENASNKELKWTSSNPNVATVKDGEVTGVGMGTTTITAAATDGSGKSAVYTVIVSYSPATRITLDLPAVSVKVGEQQGVSAILEPEATDQTNVTWSISGNNEIASVNTTSGRSVIITGAMPGKATLTARAVSWAGSGSGEVTCEVTVPGIRVVYKDEELREGQVIEIPMNGQVTFGTQRYGDAPTGSPTWISGSIGVAYFTNAASGVLCAQSLGSTEVKVTLGSYTTSFTVRVVENNANAIPWSMSSDQSLEMSDLYSQLRTAYREAREATGATNVSSYDLSYLTSLSVATSQGVLYYNYVSPSNHGYGVGAVDQYYLTPSVGQRGLQDVTFVPNAEFSGTAIIYYTGFDRNNWSFSGTIRITVSGGTDVTYTTGQNTPVTFRSTDFNEVYRELTGRDIRYVTFDLPSATQGVLYYNYIGTGQYASRVTSTERYTRTTTPTLDKITFVPAQDFYGTVRIVYHVTDTAGVASTGRLTITVTNQNQGKAGDINYNASRGETVTFYASDFRTACLDALDESLDYVYFTPPASSLGTLWYRYSSTSSRYRVQDNTRYYTTNSSARPGIGGVSFVPASTTVGVVEIPFTAYSTGGHSFTGTVSINYGDVGEGEVSYTARAGQPLQFNASDFNEVCLASSGETFSYITFDRLPTSWEGTLYYNYYSASSTGSKVTLNTRCYRTGTSGNALSRVAFVPSVNCYGTVEIPFTAYSSTGDRVFNGTLVIEVESGSALLVRYSVYSGRSVSFIAADFNAACQVATGGTLNYVRFTTPATSRGRMYLNYDASKTSNTSVSSSYSYYRTGSTRPIDQVSFVAPDSYTGTVEIPYTGTSTSGKSFTGTVVITISSPTAQNITFAANSLPLKLTGASFYRASENVLTGGLSYIQFTSLPSSSQGVLYSSYNTSTPQTGTRATTSDRYYYSGTPGISQLVFVPKAGYNGQVSLGYNAFNAAGERVTGTLIIGVSSQTGTSRFNDMGGYSWAAPAVDYLNNAGIISGVGGGRFDPDQKVKRGDFVLMLCKALGLSGTGTTSFSDVPADSYYAGAIATARNLGIISGSGGRFRPESPMTREDAMVTLQSALRAAGYNVPYAATSLLSAYTDSSRVSSYAREAVAAMVQMGIISGYGNGTLGPQNNISRAEAAVILHKILTQ